MQKSALERERPITDNPIRVILDAVDPSDGKGNVVSGPKNVASLRRCARFSGFLAVLWVVLPAVVFACDNQHERPETAVGSTENQQSESVPASESRPSEPPAEEDQAVDWALRTLRTWPDERVSIGPRDVVAVNEDGRTFAVGSALWMKLWRDGVPNPTTSVYFGRYLAFDQSGDTLHVGTQRYNLETSTLVGPSGREVQEALRFGLESASGVRSGSFEFLSFARSDDGLHLLVSTNFRSHPSSRAGAYDGPRRRLLLLDGTNGDPLAVVADSGRGWTSSAFGDELMAAGGRNVGVWRRDTAEHVTDLTGLSSSATTLAFSADGQHLVAGCNGGMICVWKIADGAGTCASFHGEDTAVVSAHPSQPVFVTGGADGLVTLRSIDNPVEPLASVSIGQPVVALDLNSSGDRLVVASSEDTSQLDLLAVDVPD